jgi:STE24 endopeptidase
VAGLAAAVGLRAGTRLLAALGLGRGAAAVLVVTAALVVAAAVLDLPFSAWRLGYERRWGFSRQAAGGWLADHAKSLVLSLCLGGGVVLALWTIVVHSTWWWLWAWLAATALSVLLVMLAPAVLAPVFNRFRELEDEALVAAARDLGRRLGVRIRQVLVMDASRRTAKHNAYFTGMGRTKRVVVWDTLLADYDAPATIAVLAHELGHWRRHHVQWLLATSAAALLPGLALLHLLLGLGAADRALGITGAADPAAIPAAALALVAGQAAWLPVAAWISRAFERQADADALGLIDDPGPFAVMMRDLAVRNLSDLCPSRWAYLLASHPPAAERIARAVSPADSRPESP